LNIAACNRGDSVTSQCRRAHRRSAPITLRATIPSNDVDPARETPIGRRPVACLRYFLDVCDEIGNPVAVPIALRVASSARLANKHPASSIARERGRAKNSRDVRCECLASV